MLSTVVLLLAVAGAFKSVQAQQCQPLSDVLQAQQGYEAFARILEAANIQIDPAKTYTVFLPADGDVANPATLTGKFAQYGIDTTSVDTIRASKFLDRIAGFLKFYIVPGSYSAEELRDRTTNDHLRTLFDPLADGALVCADPDGEPTRKNSDGDIRVEWLVDGSITLTDDSDSTQSATVTKADIPACNGSVVHLITTALNPCCTSPEQDCDAAPFDQKQLDAMSGTAAGFQQASGSRSVASAAWVAAIATLGACGLVLAL